jgi:tripartite ATP-independent transporter DctP family solute receptor
MKGVYMRKVSVGLILLLSLAMGVLGAGKQEASTKTFKFVYGGSDAVGSLFDRSNFRMVELLRERSKGQIQVDWYPADQLGGDIDQIQSTIAGTQIFYGDVLDWLANWQKDFSVMGWGFTFRNREHLQKFLKSELFKEMIGKFEKEYKVKYLGGTATDPRILFSKTPVRSLKDIEGKKMRVPEIESYLRLWEALGTRPTRITWAEIYMALKQGVVEACEGPVTAAYAAKLHEAAPYVTLTRHIQSTFFIMMNGAAWESLTPELKKVVQDCANEAIAYCDSEALKRQNDSIEKMKAEGATIIELDNIREWQEKVRGATAAMEEKGLWSKGLVEKIQKIE